jgi:hypothetical protein
VVIDVRPLADVQPLPVELEALAGQHVGDLPRDQLLDVLVGAVVVGAVRQRRGDPVGADPGADQQVAGGLGRRVRAGRVVGGLLGELVGPLQRQVAEHLVRRDVVQPDAVLADGLQDRVRADDVRLDERGRAGQGVVDVRLGREVDHDVGVGHEAVDQRRVEDVPPDEAHAAGDRVQAGLVARVGQRVQDGHLVVGVVPHRVVDEVRPDEAGAPGDKHPHGVKLTGASGG